MRIPSATPRPGVHARTWLRTAAVAVAVVGSAAVVAGCQAPFSAPPTVSVAADFSDVGDLAVGAPVELADIPVGHVTSITLQGSEARVAMAVQRSAAVPADATAELRRTSLLGERFISLVPPTGGNPAPLRDGELLPRAVVIPGIQQFVSAGASVVGAIDTTRLADLIATGAQGFGGQQQQLRQLIDGFATVAHGYASRTSDISRLVDTMDQLSSSLAPASGQDAAAVTTLAQTTSLLADQSQRFDHLLQSLQDLSVQGRGILESYIPQIDDELAGLASTSQALAATESDLGKLIDGIPGHNAAVKSATVDHQLQVLDDLVVCGLPGGGANAAVPAQTCGGGG